ncbi:hypothetical protein D3C86_1594890 [compost metagenome]
MSLKCLFQSSLFVYASQCHEESIQVIAVECPVDEGVFLFFVVQNVFIGLKIHDLKQTLTTFNDCRAVSPGKCGNNESTDLDVFFPGKLFRNLNRIRLDEVRPVVFHYFFIQIISELQLVHDFLKNIKICF